MTERRFVLSSIPARDYQASFYYEDTMRQRIEQATKPTPAQPSATVCLFPITRQGVVRDNLRAVAGWDSPSAYHRLKRTLRHQRAKLTALGVAPDKIEREVQKLADAFGIEA
jgi:hypothetical protein